MLTDVTHKSGRFAHGHGNNFISQAQWREFYSDTMEFYQNSYKIAEI